MPHKFEIGDVVRHNADNQHHKRLYRFPDELTIVDLGLPSSGNRALVRFKEVARVACMFRLELVHPAEGPW